MTEDPIEAPTDRSADRPAVDEIDSEIDGRTPLPHWHPLRARGADAASFLQGQLTNDVASMNPGAARIAGFCSAKGRLQASFLVWRLADDDFVLACASSVALQTRKRLSMFVLRARCQLSDASDEIRLHGVVGESARALLAELPIWGCRSSAGGVETVIRLPDVDGLARAVVASPAAGGVETGSGATLPLAAWQRLEVRSGIATIEAATVDRFVPQMVNFEAVGGVDFSKGCYPGQEVVARSQYRGTLKRRSFVFEGAGPAAAGDEVFHDADPLQPAGMVVNAAPAASGGGSVVLAEVKLSTLDQGSLHLRAVDGPALTRPGLPYALPAQD